MKKLPTLQDLKTEHLMEYGGMGGKLASTPLIFTFLSGDTFSAFHDYLASSYLTIVIEHFVLSFKFSAKFQILM